MKTADDEAAKLAFDARFFESFEIGLVKEVITYIKAPNDICEAVAFFAKARSYAFDLLPRKVPGRSGRH
jgi:hypothetical protein